MPKGSCCCGAVQFTIADAPSMMARCHCTRCRKLGASTFVFVAREGFALVSGGEAIATFEPGETYRYRRDFCRHCGTALGEMTGGEASFPIPADCFDDPLDMKVRFHEFVAEKPAWSAICDDAKQFAHHPVKG